MIYYTADLHFDQQSILRTALRPFADAMQMNEALIANWNRVITDDDTVYVVGDLCDRNAPIPVHHLARLKGHKHLIRGNHDTGWKNAVALFDYFETVNDYLELDDNGTHIILCHCPILYTRRGRMIHGHMHNCRGELYDILKTLPHVLNAGVDITDYTPVTLAQLEQYNARFYSDDCDRWYPTPAPTRGPHVPGWKPIDPIFYPLPVRPAQNCAGPAADKA